VTKALDRGEHAASALPVATDGKPMQFAWREETLTDGIIAALRGHKHVIVIEEHVPQGGLAPQTKQIAWDIDATCRLDTFTLQDHFIHNYGSHDDLLASHGLSIAKISQQIGLG